jgi:SAM-dependent methyltransferase
MRVLDIGSGVGDVSLLLAEIVGPTGMVVGIDVDSEALAKARHRAGIEGAQNIRFIEGDIRKVDVFESFDAAVGRLVLLHFSDPAEGIEAAARHVRAGGTIAFQEMDMDIEVHSCSYPAADTLWNVAGRAIVETFTAAGVHVRMGRKLVEVFLKAGLPTPRLLQEATVGAGPEYDGYGWIANTMRSLAPVAQKLGVTLPNELEPLESLAERIRDEVLSRNLMVWSGSYVGAYACKPQKSQRDS